MGGVFQRLATDAVREKHRPLAMIRGEKPDPNLHGCTRYTGWVPLAILYILFISVRIDSHKNFVSSCKLFSTIQKQRFSTIIDGELLDACPLISLDATAARNSSAFIL